MLFRNHRSFKIDIVKTAGEKNLFYHKCTYRFFSVNKNNSDTTFCSEFSAFFKPFSVNCDWRMSLLFDKNVNPGYSRHQGILHSYQTSSFALFRDDLRRPWCLCAYSSTCCQSIKGTHCRRRDRWVVREGCLRSFFTTVFTRLPKQI